MAHLRDGMGRWLERRRSPLLCITRPWWLIFIAHEVGHHMHHDLAGGRLRPAFAALLKVPAPDGLHTPWRRRREELSGDRVPAFTPAAIDLDDRARGVPAAAAADEDLTAALFGDEAKVLD